MVELVEEITQGHQLSPLNRQLRKATVCARRTEELQVHVIEQVDGMRGNHQMDKNCAEVEEVFHGVHRNPRPGTNVDIAMV